MSVPASQTNAKKRGASPQTIRGAQATADEGRRPQSDGDGAAAGAKRSEASREIAKSRAAFVEPARAAEITRYVRRGKSRRWLWHNAYDEAGEGAKLSQVFRYVVRPATCGSRTGDFADLRLNASGLASYTGVVRCGSVWSCPTCAAMIRGQRGVEISTAVEQHQQDGGELLFLTLTMRHRASMPLDFTLDSLIEAWHRVVNARSWRRWEAELGYTDEETDRKNIGSIKAVEVTFSKGDGWHPHLHLLLFCGKGIFDRDTPDAAKLKKLMGRDLYERKYKDVVPGDDTDGTPCILRAFRAWVFDRWATVLDSLGRKWNEKHGTDFRIKPSEAHGVDLQKVDHDGKVVALYLSKVQDDKAAGSHKWTVSGEMARSDVKEGHTGDGDAHINPFQLLDDACPCDLPQPVRRRLWTEYVSVTKGRRAIVWSRGMKDRFGLEDLTDEEILDEQDRNAVVAWRVENHVYDRARKRAPARLGWAKHLCEDQNWRKLAEILPGELIMVDDDGQLWQTAADGSKESTLDAIRNLDQRYWRNMMAAVS